MVAFYFLFYFYAAPNLVTTEQRHNAEVFLNFRKFKSPYELYRQILGINTNDYIVFEAGKYRFIVGNRFL